MSAHLYKKTNPGQILINCFVLFILHSLAANFSKRRSISAGAKIKHICYNKNTKPINDSFSITIKYKHVFLFYYSYQTRINIILYIASLHGELNYVKSLPPIFLPSKKHFNCKFAFWSSLNDTHTCIKKGHYYGSCVSTNL